MSQKLSSAYCATCDAQRMMVKTKPNHVLHLILTLVTFGVWLLVWVPLIVLAAGRPSRCTECGSKPGVIVAPTRARNDESPSRTLA